LLFAVRRAGERGVRSAAGAALPAEANRVGIASLAHEEVCVMAEQEAARSSKHGWKTPLSRQICRGRGQPEPSFGTTAVDLKKPGSWLS